MIKSEGSVVSNPNDPMCLKINNNNRFYKQRVMLAKCNANDPLQQFNYVSGRLYSRANSRLCAGYEYNKYASAGTTAFIFSTCYPNAWAVNTNIQSRKRRQVSEGPCTPAPQRLMTISSTFQSTSGFNSATTQSVAQEVQDILDNTLPTHAEADHVFIDQLCNGPCQGNGNQNKAGAIFTAEIIYDAKYLDYFQVVAGALAHNRIGNPARTVSDTLYYPNQNTATTTTAGATTTTPAATTTTVNICDAHESQQCPGANNTPYCWNQLAIQCNWPNLFDTSICDEEDETKQCPNDDAACWNYLTAKCGW
jgi:hypothetical protein